MMVAHDLPPVPVLVSQYVCNQVSASRHGLYRGCLLTFESAVALQRHARALSSSRHQATSQRGEQFGDVSIRIEHGRPYALSIPSRP